MEQTTEMSPQVPTKPEASVDEYKSAIRELIAYKDDQILRERLIQPLKEMVAE